MASASTPNSKKHQKLYKAGSPAPAWKEAFRKRCLDRLRMSRDKFVGHLRMVDDGCMKNLMTDEWRQLKQEHEDLPDVEDSYFDIDNDLSGVNEILSIFEEIKKELLLEEQSLLAEYEKNQQFCEADLCAAVSSMCNEVVMCPVCKKDYLIQNKSIIFCKCGVHIDTELDSLTISDLRSQIEEGNKAHSRNCSKTPVFSIINEMGFSNLLMSCPICDFMFFVI